ncbi:MAG: hypothetical protein ACK4SX_09970 [Alcanivoracaceae bacterium]
MNELLRQRYLRQMGFTPWVAAEPLPGAAPSVLLEWPETGAARAPVPATIEAADPAPVSMPSLTPESLPASAATAAAAEPAGGLPVTPSLAFTLQAHATGTLQVWTEQQRVDAPSLGRDELQLLTALMKLFNGVPQPEGKRLVCGSTAGQPMTAEVARSMFSVFLRSLLGRDTEVRVLLCVSDDTARALFDAPRYQPVMVGKVQCLPVSSLAEMLADPAQHKRLSWQAMLAHGFHG